MDLIVQTIQNQKLNFAGRTIALNAMAAPAVTGGVGYATFGTATLVTDGLYGHMNQTSASKNLWVDVIGSHTSGKVDAFEFGKTKTGYKSSKLGAVVGFDMPLLDKLNAGIALSFVKDKVENKATFTAQNKVNTFGLSAYARYDLSDAAHLGAQLSYLHGENKITDTANAKSLEAKVKTNAFVASVKGGFDMTVRSFTVTPHIGLNVIYAKQGSFDTLVGSQKFANTSAKASTTVELPVGVTAKTTMDVKGWKVTPQADVSVAPVFGKRHTSYTITGVSGGTSQFDAQFVGKYVANAGLGLSATHNTVTVGAFYNATMSKNGLDNQIKLELQKAF